MRTDEHKPSVLDPAEYVEVGYFDNHPEEGGCWISHEMYDKYGAVEGDTFDGNYTEKGRCDHCGAGPLRYGVVFLHIPTKKEVVVGERCATILGLESKSAKEHKRLLEDAIRERKVREFTAAAPENAEARQYLIDKVIGQDDHGYGGFYFDLLHKLNRYGSLSEKQVAAVLKGKAREEEFAAKKQAEAALAQPFRSGKRVVEGTLVSSKWQDNDYDGAMKMLIDEGDGNKLWGTMPSLLVDFVLSRPIGYDAIKGMKVRFSAQVVQKKGEEHFGFYKRPTKVEIIEVPEGIPAPPWQKETV